MPSREKRVTQTLEVPVWEEHFDKRMALEVIEDALGVMSTPESCGYLRGLCGAFYLCGLLSKTEWEGVLRRIPCGERGRAQ